MPRTSTTRPDQHVSAHDRPLTYVAIRNYQTELRLFSEYLTDARYCWAAECEAEFGRGVYPVPICQE
jgi:hypothetical protein